MLSEAPSVSMPKRTTARWRPVGVVVGGILVHLSLGTLYTFGNLNPYLTSYMRGTPTDPGVAPDLTYTKCAWIFASTPMGIGSSMFLSGIIERKIGPRLTSLLGGWLMSLGVFLTFFAVKQSFGLTVFTYGLMFGVGSGLAYAIPLSCAMKWMPDKKGLVNGLIVAGFGAGAVIFDQVQTAYINPHDLEPTCKSGGEKYFCEKSLLDKVPHIFLILGACYATMQLIGSLLIVNPPPVEHELVEEGLPDKEQLTVQQPGGTDQIPSTTQCMRGQDDYEMHPKQVLKSRHFYTLFFMLLFSAQGMIFVSSLYKAYGQTFIEDDTFLSIVGTVAAVFNGTGRIFWGRFADKFSFRLAALFMNGMFCCLMLTFEVSHLGGKVPFTIYVCLLFGTFSGIFALFPTATAKCFGRRYMAMNYGLLSISMTITSPIGTLVPQVLMSAIGWSGLFFVVAGCSFVSLLLTFTFSAKDKNGRDI